MTHRPAVVAFDVIETLMSLEPLRERLTEIGQPPHLLEAWYTRTLRDGMALSATGDFAPFTDVAEAALRLANAGFGRRHRHHRVDEGGLVDHPQGFAQPADTATHRREGQEELVQLALDPGGELPEARRDRTSSSISAMTRER